MGFVVPPPPPPPPGLVFPANTAADGLRPYIPQPRPHAPREAREIVEEMLAICDAGLQFDPLYHPERTGFSYPPFGIGIPASYFIRQMAVPTGNPGT
jgi:hypothetical protein